MGESDTVMISVALNRDFAIHFPEVQQETGTSFVLGDKVRNVSSWDHKAGEEQAQLRSSRQPLSSLWAAFPPASQGVTALYFSCSLAASSVNSLLRLPGAVGNLSAPESGYCGLHIQRDAPPALPPVPLPKMSLSQRKAV